MVARKTSSTLAVQPHPWVLAVGELHPRLLQRLPYSCQGFRLPVRFATLDRVIQVGTYAATVTYPNNGFGLALRTIAGAMVKGVGTKVFWVQTGGYDTHAAQNPNQANGSYAGLMATLNDGLFAF